MEELLALAQAEERQVLLPGEAEPGQGASLVDSEVGEV